VVTLAGRTLSAGLRVLELTGVTPNGELYRARYPSGREVAVLLLPPEASNSEPFIALRQRLRDAIRIQHPNVAAIYDVAETDDQLVYVVVESVTGELLADTLARRGALPVSEALDLCRQAADGLQAAHEAGWVHGRLSPESILLSRATGDGSLVKLIGFTPEFFPRTGEAELTSAPDVALEYSSPERIAGNPPDVPGDVYSLAAVLHHLITGVPPRKGGAAPEALRAVLARALDPSPDERFQTVADFAAALAPAMEPVVHPAEPQPNQLPEPTKAARRRFLPTLWPEERAVAATLLTVAAGLALLWITQRSGLLAIRRHQLEESAAVAPLSSDSISTSSAVLPPSRLPATPPPPPTMRRETVSSRIPAASRPRVITGTAGADSLLVDVRSLDPTIQTDLRYATANNFTGAPLPGYEAARALLRPEAAAALARVQASLRSKGLGLRILDAYRPLRASRAMVEWAQRTGNRSLLRSGYIAERSRHNLGASVDVTLVDLARGTEIMPTTAFDNFTGSADSADTTGQAMRYRKILVQAMESEGFTPYGQAWWHFNYPLEDATPLDQVIR
jgi:zinc D-Ala-D-Ala dipeptidase